MNDVNVVTPPTSPRTRRPRPLTVQDLFPAIQPRSEVVYNLSVPPPITVPGSTNVSVNRRPDVCIVSFQ